jgi:hemerythrin-like metal-binding protein
MMDRSHHVLFNDLSSLASQDGDKFDWRFASMVGDLERDFYLEDEWMERIAFGDAPSHREQHAIILAALHRTHAKVMAGDIEFGRMMVIALSAWLDNHIATTDGRLALAIRRAEPH